METNNEIYAAAGNEFESANCHDIIDARTIVISSNRVASFLQIYYRVKYHKSYKIFSSPK